VLSDLHKGFGSLPVLTGVDLAVPPGSFTAILGPSGSGKTTLLRVVAGFERVDRGSVAVGGVVVDGGPEYVPAERRRIGYVSQEGSLFPHLTVAANVGFGLARHERRGHRVGELIEMVGLSGQARRYPHQLSGGQQQRVALARALAVRPDVVLLDEPFASLDAQLRSSVRSDVKEILRRAGATSLLVTHDQDEALSLADRVAVIRAGTIAQYATPQDLYADPSDPDLSRSVGAANLFEGVVDGGMVDTPFGRTTAVTAAPLPPRAPVVVLVRPEQIDIHVGRDGEGLAGRVRNTDFHGHDTVVYVQPESDRVRPLVVVRTLGDLMLQPGSAVTLRVHGPVRTWPRPATEGPATGRAQGAPGGRPPG
jgi:iron(III) transport system ATP-binding protein